MFIPRKRTRDFRLPLNTQKWLSVNSLLELNRRSLFFFLRFSRVGGLVRCTSRHFGGLSHPQLVQSDLNALSYLDACVFACSCSHVLACLCAGVFSCSRVSLVLAHSRRKLWRKQRKIRESAKTSV